MATNYGCTKNKASLPITAAAGVGARFGKAAGAWVSASAAVVVFEDLYSTGYSLWLTFAQIRLQPFFSILFDEKFVCHLKDSLVKKNL